MIQISNSKFRTFFYFEDMNLKPSYLKLQNFKALEFKIKFFKYLKLVE